MQRSELDGLSIGLSTLVNRLHENTERNEDERREERSMAVLEAGSGVKLRFTAVCQYH